MPGSIVDAAERECKARGHLVEDAHDDLCARCGEPIAYVKHEQAVWLTKPGFRDVRLELVPETGELRGTHCERHRL